MFIRALVFTLTLATCAALPVAAVAQSSQTPPAQPPPGPPPDCSGEEHHQFDFWIGDWTVTGPQGQAAGTNRIESVMKGCALVENWVSATGVAGISINFYDRRAGAWFQNWIDERGGALRMQGGLVDGKMIMRSEPATRPDGTTVVHRVTWSKEDGGTVRQFWESTTDNGQTWTVAFDGIYARTSR